MAAELAEKRGLARWYKPPVFLLLAGKCPAGDSSNRSSPVHYEVNEEPDPPLTLGHI